MTPSGADFSFAFLTLCAACQVTRDEKVISLYVRSVLSWLAWADVCETVCAACQVQRDKIVFSIHMGPVLSWPAQADVCETLCAACQVTRDKNVIKPAKGKLQCNCKQQTVTKLLGPGMFQQFQTQECEQCTNVKYARESETLQVTVEPGMQDKEVCSFLVSV